MTNMIGKGAHGTIYVAEDMTTNMQVAIKLVSNKHQLTVFLLIPYFLDAKIKQKQGQVQERDCCDDRYGG